MKTKQLTEDEKAQAFIKDMVDMNEGSLDRDGCVIYLTPGGRPLIETGIPGRRQDP